MRQPDKTTLENLVYRYMYPIARPGNPSDFIGFVRSNIIPEVRSENLRFYGPSESLESRYPGLDYSNPGHRVRLGQFHYHRKLFAAFDGLRLSKHEIHAICTWEGTRAARDKFEAENRATIRDTTFDNIPLHTRREPTVTRHALPPLISNVSARGVQVISPRSSRRSHRRSSREVAREDTPMEEESEQESSDDIISRSIGMSLNRRLIAASERRYRGEPAVMDPAWEQWMKDATERGSIPSISVLGSNSRLAAFQAHIPAHYAYATPLHHYGPHSPAPPTFSPTTAYHQQPLLPRPVQSIRSIPAYSFSARQSRRNRAYTAR